MYLIKARHGRSIRLSEGQRIRIYNPSGSQVVDFFAFSPPTVDRSSDASSSEQLEFLSVAQTRVSNLRLIPQPNDVLFSNLRRPMFTITEDTWIEGGGKHDTLIPACDEIRYRNLGVKFPSDPDPGEGHRSCATNLEEELSPEQDRAVKSGKIQIAAPCGPKGGSVELRAEMDVLVIMSACPNDLAKTNGEDMVCKDVGFDILT
ncbi:hypothetical protein G7Y79_00037g073640 [Physcia stellaris]|nr:hypothetical protein G7Y79_00037g073640 [Physcia stellaris]